jgi:hypothetical protein
VVLLWKLNFAKDIYLRDSKERFVPYMASSIFYFWNFYVHHRTPYSPQVYNSFLLGGFITLSLLFLGNIFLKASMHMAGITGLFTFMLLLVLFQGCPSYIYILILGVVVAIVYWSRKTLKEHTTAELILGMVIGMVSQAGCWFWYYQ